MHGISDNTQRYIRFSAEVFGRNPRYAQDIPKTHELFHRSPPLHNANIAAHFPMATPLFSSNSAKKLPCSLPSVGEKEKKYEN